MTVTQKIARILTDSSMAGLYGKVVSLVFITSFCVSGFLIYLKPEFFIYWLFGFVLILIGFEIILRLILRLAYGKKYIYSVINYFLIDDPLYGDAYRKNCHSKKLDFLIFDRLAFPEGTEKILSLDENKAKRNDININSLGFRGEEFSPLEKKSRLRVFCSGGSTTAGFQVDDNQTWPAQLQLYLRNQGYDVEVINAGVFGWFSYQEFLRFKKEISNYKADIVLVHQGWNEEFEYSSLRLGKEWRPKMIRNVNEHNDLDCPPNTLLSSTRILSLYLAFRAFRKNIIFKRNMSFTNSRRWEVLLNNRYILAWFDNLVNFARCAERNNILMYTIDYPCLSTMADTESDREFYIQNSRLTQRYADYQSVSKKRITRTLQSCKSLIPCLDTEQDFDRYKRAKRIELFSDELHMTAKGYSLLGQAIGNKLINDINFQKRYNESFLDSKTSNVNTNKELIDSINKILQKNSPYLERFVKKKIEEIKTTKKNIKDVQLEISEDRYTTF